MTLCGYTFTAKASPDLPPRSTHHRQQITWYASFSNPSRQPAKERSYMHLTNYSINKTNELFTASDQTGTTGSKRRLTSVMQQLRERGLNVDGIWGEIKLIAVKTLLAIQPKLSHLYNTCSPNSLCSNGCFELLGFDIMLAQKKGNRAKPLLLEVILQ